MGMFETKKFHGALPGETSSLTGPDAGHRRHDPASSLPTYADPGRDIPMLGAIREMLGLAVETAFDLRGGHRQSAHLEQFSDMVDRQIRLLDGLDKGHFASDPGLLMHRANMALDAFALAVREEIVDCIRPGIDPGAFNLALQRMTDRAIAAGVAFASLDLALDRTL